MKRKTSISWLIVCLLALGSWRTVMAEDTVQPQYLGDTASDRILFSSQSWGRLGLNTAVVPTDGRAATPLRIKDTAYEHGLGHHANGEIVVELAGAYKTFEAEVGVQWQQGTTGTVVFQVLVDGQKRFDSGVMKEQDAAQPVRVPVAGAYELRLVATDAGDGIMCDCADWAEARLIPDPDAAARPPVETADMAPFAQVMTWDPARIEGTAAKRTEEFPARDVFLGAEVLPNASGVYAVPTAVNGEGCIGLEWAERRFVRRLGLQFADAAHVPATDNVRVEFWTGESVWQGAWKPCQAMIEAAGDSWTVRIDYRTDTELRNGTERIRWVFPVGTGPVVVRALSAHTASRWDTVDLRVEMDAPKPGEATVEAYNGLLVDAGGTGVALERAWDLNEPLALTVRYSNSRVLKTDRTVLRFGLPDAAFGVAVQDVLENGCVYVPYAGLFVTTGPSLAEYRAQTASDRTVLERVREMPDQTFAQALEKVHNPIQDLGPMMISLACDNRKFVAYREGPVTFHVYEAADQGVPSPSEYACRLAPQFGAGEPQEVTRHLRGGWLPAPETTATVDGVRYTSTPFVAPCDDTPVPDTCGWLYTRAVCSVEYVIENPGNAPVEATLALALTADVKANRAAQIETVDGGALARDGERVFAFVDAAGAAPLALTSTPEGVRLAGTLAAGQRAACVVYLPAWQLAPADFALLEGPWQERFERYWQAALETAAQIEVPDELLNNVIRASQVHCLLAARNEAMGQRISADIASDRYGPLESEAHAVIRGMDLLGQTAYAQRGLDFFIHRYSDAGYLTTGYTLMGTGWHLWTLGEHYNRTRDQAWLERVAPEVARACAWISRQRERTQRLDAHGGKMPEYGLVPPGVGADWNRYAYRFAVEGHYCAGLDGAARVLAEIDRPEAPALVADAAAFREDLLRAYHWNQERAPVQRLADGTWVPGYPGMLYCFGRIEDIIPGEDGNRSWAYDVELGAHHLAAQGILDAGSPEVGWMMDHMEDFWFLHSGMGDYLEDKNHADWFDLGGFAKVQPYYTRNAEICALRDDVKPFIRSYFNTIPTLLSLENLSFWEHFHNTGAWNKTHETGYFLAQTRLMLVQERGNDLWLAPFVTDNWLKDGLAIAVRDVPTRFGPVSFRIASHVAAGAIEAVIEPPTRNAPDHIVLRLRHPEDKPMRKVTLDGKPSADFDPAAQCITIAPAAGPVTVRAEY